MEYKIKDQIEAQFRDWNSKYSIDLRERLLNFSVNVILFLSSLPQKREYDMLKAQLSKSATSIGSNFEEA